MIERGNKPVMLIALSLCSFAAFGATSAVSDGNQKVSTTEVSQWLGQYYDQMSPKERGGVGFKFTEPGYDSEQGSLMSKQGFTCHEAVSVADVSRERRREIIDSEAYKKGESNCYSVHESDVKKSIKMGLIEKAKTSPYVFRYTLTDAGREHILSGDNHQLVVMMGLNGLDQILSVQREVNRYGVTIVNVKFTTSPKLLSWAKPYVGGDKLVTLRMPEPKQHVAQFWKTDEGWKPLYLY